MFYKIPAKPRTLRLPSITWRGNYALIEIDVGHYHVRIFTRDGFFHIEDMPF